MRRPRQPQGSLLTPALEGAGFEPSVPLPAARMSSVVAFMRATRGPRACKFPVRRRFSSICSSRRATPWSRGECGLGSLRRHLTPLRRRPILELCQCNMRPCARRAAAGPAADRVYRCPSFSLEIEHFRGSAPGVDLVRRSSRRQRYCRIPPDKSAVFCRRPTSSSAPPLSAGMECISDR